MIERMPVDAAGPGLRTRILRVVMPPALVGLPLLVLLAALPALPLPAGGAGFGRQVLVVGVLLCATWLALRAVRAVVARVLREHPVDIADNLRARKVQTQARVISGIVQGAIVLFGLGLALMTIPGIRRIGATLLASAGLIGLVAGFAAKPVFGNLIAGLQIAIAQPIRLDDVVIVEGEWGRIEEINATYVVVRIWDERRMVVPLQWFIEHPFENWTRTTAQLLGSALLWLDYRVPMDAMRAELQRICNTDPRWDGRVCVAQVTDAAETTLQVRLLVSARNSGDLFDLRCAVRERMVAWLQQAHPEALPLQRLELARATANAGQDASLHALHAGGVADATASPGAEDSNAADAAAAAQRASAGA
ncbi:mechanosensitive ion channel family protein [Luteimonas sp. 50]|uniref:Mechanosensitive ion channel family protein n=1 Tax=Cognatiluteimonas sedimenti TaxID=2927791 RepID=A0ABT0A6E2_9GAMM|nr:mechanosensitive ion channel domain-containing protein [Lysobacter sedimenti]MCJ0826563.1 mechanosensitive ion channel family protein [Lysobacter sedimenti]